MCTAIVIVRGAFAASLKSAKMIGVITSHDSGVYRSKKQSHTYYYCYLAGCLANLLYIEEQQKEEPDSLAEP
jgi:hypothetical protein